MAYSDRHDIVFEQCFKNNPEGHALYLPVSSLALKPGACGYSDENGNWQTIVHLTDPAALRNQNYTEADSVVTDADPIKQYWSPVTSDEVFEFNPNLEINASVPGAPVSAGINVGYRIRKETGAIVVTDGRVTYNQLNPQACDNAKEWFVTNAASILLQRSITKEKGIWIITKTYTAQRRAVALLKNQEREVSFGVSLDLFSGNDQSRGKLVEWEEGAGLEDGTTCKLEDCVDGSDSIPVFMCGWYWRPRLLSRKPNPTAKSSEHKKFLGGADNDESIEVVIPVHEDLEEVVKLGSERRGKFEVQADEEESEKSAPDRNEETSDSDDGDDSDNE